MEILYLPSEKYSKSYNIYDTILEDMESKLKKSEEVSEQVRNQIKMCTEESNKMVTYRINFKDSKQMQEITLRQRVLDIFRHL
jgi:C-terminal processing protease CtpA/Prc